MSMAVGCHCELKIVIASRESPERELGPSLRMTVIILVTAILSPVAA
jgi:hypothetical protein